MTTCFQASKQICKQRMHSSSLGCVAPALYRTARTEIPWTETPLDRPPKRNMGPETDHPLQGTWDQAARQEVMQGFQK